MMNRMRSSHDELIASAVLAGHIRSLQAEHLIDVPSSDRHTVKPWFQGKLDFSPPVPDLSELGWNLIGGRLDYVDGRPVAVLVYQRRMHNINVFVWPNHDPVSVSNTIQEDDAQGYQILHWNGAEMTYWVVSDLNNAELLELASKPLAGALEAGNMQNAALLVLQGVSTSIVKIPAVPKRTSLSGPTKVDGPFPALSWCVGSASVFVASRPTPSLLTEPVSAAATGRSG